MAKRIRLETTEKELRAMIDMCDTISAMMGEGGSFTDEQKINVRAFDRMLKRNGYERQYN